MPVLERGTTRLYYEEKGTGFPLLLLAPGGVRSSIDFWKVAPWQPVAELAGQYRTIAMDQRNAGRSFAPIQATDGWDVYADDQLGLLDALGIDRCHVLGMCMGCSFVLSLLKRAPERFVAVVALQPIGVDANRDYYREAFDTFAAEQYGRHPEARDNDWRGLRENLFGTDHTLFSVPDQALETIRHPVLVALGSDKAHPESASYFLVDRVPNASLIKHWKTEEHLFAGLKKVREFLAMHTPTRLEYDSISASHKAKDGDL